MRFTILAALVTFVITQLHPELIISSSTPTGGDVGAHVWFPPFLRSTLPGLSGWSDDWFAGFPAGTFYFPMPALLTAALSLLVDENVAFKLVLVAGTVLLPVACWRFASAAKLGSPTPELCAAAAVVFSFDRFHTIFGGNAASALAGMFSLSLGLSIGLLFAADLLETARIGTHPARTALLACTAALCHLLAGVFVAVTALLILACTPQRRQALRHSTPPLLVAAALTACWSVPFVANLSFTTDMGYERYEDVVGWLLPFLSSTLPSADTAHLWPTAALALAGAVVAVRSGNVGARVLTAGTVVFASLFALWPTGHVWNTRWLPYYYLFAYLLGAVGLGALCRHLRVRLRAPTRPRRTPIAATTTALVAVVMLPALLPSGLLPTAVPFAAANGQSSTVSAWASWDLSGYESKDGHAEYEAVIGAMGELGRHRGCGRALWEYDADQGSYGTPMAMMLLPYWTDGCIDSLEGLFMESSATTPFHFLTQSGVSAAPSMPMRGLPYRSFDLDWGVPAMESLGVRYYMTYNEESAASARLRSDLRLVSEAGPWSVFELADWSLVEALDHEPVVLEGGATAAAVAFARYQDAAVTYAAQGPSSWLRSAIAPARPRPVEPAQLSEVHVESGHVEFQVDRVGTPILVRQSYFPSWRATGADGPYPAGPNMMVVVPTDTSVTLHAGAAPYTEAGWAITAGGALALLLLHRRSRRASRSTCPDRTSG